jgi:hypothetical protein
MHSPDVETEASKLATQEYEKLQGEIERRRLLIEEQ